MSALESSLTTPRISQRVRITPHGITTAVRRCWRSAPLGTRSLFVGAHQFILHPLALLVAWTQLYGLPLDPRIWLAALVHDWGYWGCDDMDAGHGLHHPQLGANIMRQVGALTGAGDYWWAFTAGHSRSYARLHGIATSPLCAADKLATAIAPAWLFVALVRASGELPGYMAMNHASGTYTGTNPREWFRALCHEFPTWAFADAATRGIR